MNAGERVRVDLLDVRSFCSHGSIVTFERLTRFHIGSSPKTILH
ncbi:hypothetical protein Gotur_031359 [Gossypium turneri]